MSDLPNETPEDSSGSVEGDTPDEPLETPDEPVEEPVEDSRGSTEGDKPKKRKGYNKDGKPRKPLTDEHLNQLKIARELALKKRQEICRKKQELVKKEKSYEERINQRIERLAIKEKILNATGLGEPYENKVIDETPPEEPQPSLPLPIPLKRTTSIFMKADDGHFYF